MKLIPNSMFYKCTSLNKIIIPASVTSIGDEAFYDCYSLVSISIENSNCTIYDSADTISDTAVIYGYANSTAQSYAEKYNRTFVEITE